MKQDLNVANLPAMERPNAIPEAVAGLPSSTFEEKGELMHFIMELVRRRELLHPQTGAPGYGEGCIFLPGFQ